MRPQNLFRQIIDRLSSPSLNEQISLKLSDDFSIDKKSIDLDSSFLELSRLPLPLGWNKLWEGYRIYGWYGSQVVFYPLRILALEWRELVDIGDEIRPFLNRYYKGYSSLEEIPDLARSFLSNIAIPLEPFREKIFRNFLQRINADTREMPLVERWRWAREWGWVQLSDGDTIQIGVLAAWTRILDPLIFSPHPMSNQMKSSLKKVISTHNRADLILCYGTDAEERCLQTLEFYGLGERWREGYHLIHHPTPNVLKFFNVVLRAKS
ncbi:MAG: hypothetical protein ACK4OO_03350 [bacterium]